MDIAQSNTLSKMTEFQGHSISVKEKPKVRNLRIGKLLRTLNTVEQVRGLADEPAFGPENL